MRRLLPDITPQHHIDARPRGSVVVENETVDGRDQAFDAQANVGHSLTVAERVDGDVLIDNVVVDTLAPHFQKERFSVASVPLRGGVLSYDRHQIVEVLTLFPLPHR